MVCKIKNQRQLLLAVIALSVMILMTSCVTVGEEMHSTPEFKGKIARSYEDSQEFRDMIRKEFKDGTPPA